MSKPGLSVAVAVAMVLGGSFFPHGSAMAQNGFRVDPASGFEAKSPASGDRSGERPKRSHERDGKIPTEITASKETTFDEKTRKAVFLGDVSVKDAQFHLTCEKLTAYLRRDSSREGAERKAPEAGGGLERAVAEGGVVIVQEKVDDKGEVTRYVGKARKAEYDAATGNVTLSGWPQIQQGINTQVATEEGTVMILNQKGALQTRGPSKTVISDSSGPVPGKKEKNASPRPGAMFHRTATGSHS
ncbi:MAG TPA: LptA/OstA family protein [Chthoniobacteraceae bacterium]|nr:LptA/OstA family protein [Chthoniobacteraceae bacterium]